jgi:hypothetical protein
MPILDQGLDQAETINEQIKAERPRLYFRPEMLTIKDGDTHYLHFYTPHTQVLSAQVHQFMPTKPQPEQYTGTNWAKMMWAICMNDKIYRLRNDDNTLSDGFEPGYGDCWLHNQYRGVKDPKYGKDRSIPTYVTFGLAVPQIPVGADGQPVKGKEGAVAFADEMVTFRDPKTKELIQIPKMVIVGQRYEPLWHPVKATAYVEPHEIRDKVFLVQRKGNQDKDWNVAPVAYTRDCQPGTEHWKGYDEAVKLLGFDLQDWFLSHGTQDHYDRWFIPGAIPKDGYARRDGDDEEETATAATAPATTAASPAVDQDKLAGFRESLAARGGSVAAAEPIS